MPDYYSSLKCVSLRCFQCCLHFASQLIFLSRDLYSQPVQKQTVKGFKDLISCTAGTEEGMRKMSMKMMIMSLSRQSPLDSKVAMISPPQTLELYGELFLLLLMRVRSSQDMMV